MNGFWRKPAVFNAFLFLALITVLLSVYGPALTGGFIWDDDIHLTQNPNLHDGAGLMHIWTSPSAFYYPLTSTTFWIGKKLWGFSPFPFHLLNVLLHGLNALLFALVLKRLSVRGAWISAFIFALHPVHVESVAWVTELKNTQSMFFYLLSLLSYLSGKRSGGAGVSSGVNYGAGILFFILALLSKTASVMLPVVLVLLHLRGNSKPPGTFKKTALRLLPFFLLSAAAAGWTIWEQKFHSGAAGVHWGFSWIDRFLISLHAFWFYLGKLAVPYPLIFIYPQWDLNVLRQTFPWPLAGIFLTAFFLLWFRRKKEAQAIGQALAYYGISLFPVLGFFNIYFMRYSFVADHFQYFASLGPIALFGASLSMIPNAKIKTLAIGLCLLVFSILGLRQARMYHSEEMLWRGTIYQNQNSWLAHNNLANLLIARGKHEEAKIHYEKALEAKPDFTEARTNLGVALIETGHPEEAIPHFLTALQENPNSAEAHNALGNALSRTGKSEEAIRHYQKAIELRPDFAAAYNNLGFAFFAKKNVKEAIIYYEKALQLDPNSPQIKNNLSIARRYQAAL